MNYNKFLDNAPKAANSSAYSQPLVGAFLALLFLLSLTLLSYFTARTQTLQLYGFYTIAFICYYFYFKKSNTQSWIWLGIGIGIAARFITLFHIPNLSDDVYRFIWDGRLLLQGINPFEQLPSYYIEQGISIPGITQDLYDNLNSPNYFTIYPPVLQGIFFFSVWLFPSSVFGATLVMKSFLFLFEIGSILLIINTLKSYQLPFKNVLLYALNPLAIIEITGNLHFEGAMIFFVLLAIYLLLKNRHDLSAISMAFGVAAKLLPLMFLPFLLHRLGWKKAIRYYLVGAITLVLLFLPLVNNGFFNGIGNSLGLYFQRFEFNASLYYLFRWVGFQFSGYNLISIFGPALSLLAMTFILWEAFTIKSKNFNTLPHNFILALCAYFFIATIIHPWYVTTLVALAAFTRFRFPVVWSFFIFGTYINYSYSPYFENLWVVAIEYIVVFVVLLWELQKESRLQATKS